ncbi:efflux RND transporter periplasmic adaptor subunit [Anoxynatronum buryatiense]|uniref:HlyD family secretion protein n=1 Tax=Anoxynatronum buryatiense TaxID=489973 RepID=A0AA45WW15_9CLOT|nr:efflux RND transporter periplasmic adaptor subunit [Anoxynatronum buryatiense]SMP56156.1 HlyD family secretion protein [Anoxynatronum buryatiense]
MKLWMKWTTALVLVIMVGLSLYFLLPERTPAPPELLGMEATPFVQRLSATGRMVPARQVQLQAQVAGRLLSLEGTEGDTVSEGQVLAVIDDGDARQRVAESRASLTLAQSRTRLLSELAVPVTREELEQLNLNREQLVRTLERQEALYSQGALPLEPLEETRNALEVLNSRIRSTEISLAAQETGGAEAAETAATVAQARSSLETLERELAKYSLQAPFNGVVLERLAEPGEWVQPGSTLLILAADEGYYAEVELDERVMGLVAVGQPARLWPEAYPSREVAARVAFIAPRVNAATGTVRIQLALEEQADYLIQDLTIQAEIQVRELAEALLLPVAFRWEENPLRVLVLEDGTVNERPITAEAVSSNQWLILDGLSAGDQVIHPSSGLKPGDSLVLPEATAPEGGDAS